MTQDDALPALPSAARYEIVDWSGDYDGPMPSVPFYTAEQMRAYARAALAARAGEPVAWRWKPSRVWPSYFYTDDARQAEAASDFTQVEPLFAAPPAPSQEAMREADAVVAKLRALHRTTMGYEDACVLRGAEMVADTIRAALGGGGR
jgi:hypothetical protein